MKQWIMMVGGFLSWIPASLFSQTLWVTSLDSIDLDKSVADLKDCYAVEFLLETPAAEELPVDIYLSTSGNEICGSCNWKSLPMCARFV